MDADDTISSSLAPLRIEDAPSSCGGGGGGDGPTINRRYFVSAADYRPARREVRPGAVTCSRTHLVLFAFQALQAIAFVAYVCSNRGGDAVVAAPAPVGTPPPPPTDNSGADVVIGILTHRLNRVEAKQATVETDTRENFLRLEKAVWNLTHAVESIDQ